MKRFWTTTQTTKTNDGFGIELDGRAVRTPAKTPLVVPTQALADMIAAEWQAQDGKIDPTTMPATRMANAAIDKVAHQFDGVAEMIAAYGDSDLLCYRATSPVELIDRQANKWDPLLDWAHETLNARLVPVSGIMHRPQDQAALGRLAAQVHALTPFELSAFHDLVAISGSLIIGFAVAKGLADQQELWEAACLDEIWQEEQWGRDDDAYALRQRKKQDFFDAGHFFRACMPRYTDRI